MSEKTVNITVTRAFRIAGQTQEEGSRLDVAVPLSIELISMNKAVLTPAEKPAKPEVYADEKPKAEAKTKEKDHVK